MWGLNWIVFHWMCKAIVILWVIICIRVIETLPTDNCNTHTHMIFHPQFSFPLCHTFIRTTLCLFPDCKSPATVQAITIILKGKYMNPVFPECFQKVGGGFLICFSESVWHTGTAIHKIYHLCFLSPCPSPTPPSPSLSVSLFIVEIESDVRVMKKISSVFSSLQDKLHKDSKYIHTQEQEHVCNK